jgi:hypothetical protein
MPKRERPLPSNIVAHWRYGSAPRPSGIRVSEEEIRNGFWRHPREHIFPESVLIADPSKQNYATYPRSYYVDVLRECRSCGRPFIFFALEQRHWFETLGFYVDANCVLCPSCRRDSQSLRRRLRRYSDLLQKDEASPRELRFLVDDGAYLFARGVLKDINSLGRLKNRALKVIPDYAGTKMLAQELANARGAKNAL